MVLPGCLTGYLIIKVSSILRIHNAVYLCHEWLVLHSIQIFMKPIKQVVEQLLCILLVLVVKLINSVKSNIKVYTVFEYLPMIFFIYQGAIEFLSSYQRVLSSRA
jgi:hypothetical protein